MGLIDEIGKNRENGEKEEIAEESATSVETEEAPTTSPEVSEEAIEDVSNEQVSEQVVAPKHSFLSEIVEDKSSKRETAAEVPLWYSVFLGIIGVIIAIDDEWIWIPGTIYGVCFWVYKRVKAMAYEVVSLPPAIMLSGLGSASIATVTSPTLAATLKPLLGSYGKGFRTLAKDMFLTPSGLVSPLTWALRFGWFTKLLHNKIDDTTPAENTFKHRLICMGTIAAFSETFARLATAPFAKLVDLKRKSPGASSAHVVRSMFKKDGLFGPWIGMAPLRVEVPHMAILLSTWGMSREYVSRHLPKVSDDDIGRKVLTRLPVDFACGAFAATVAYSITHSFRMSAEENRKHIYEVLVKQKKETVCPFVFRHGAVSLQQSLALRVPHTALLFGLYGSLMTYFSPEYKEAGVAGWGEREVTRYTKYGGHLDDVEMKELSFWQFFGGRMTSVKRYD